MSGSHDRLKILKKKIRLVPDDLFTNLSIEGSDCKNGLIKSAKDSSDVQLESLSEWDANKGHSLLFWNCQGFRFAK